MPHFHYNHYAGISLLPLFKLSVPPLFILHNPVMFGLLFFQMGSRKTHRNMRRNRWEVSWATCYQQSVSLPSLPSQQVKSMGGRSQLQCNANLRLQQDQVLLKMQVHHDKLKRNVKALALGEFLCYHCITQMASGN